MAKFKPGDKVRIIFQTPNFPQDFGTIVEIVQETKDKWAREAYIVSLPSEEGMNVFDSRPYKVNRNLYLSYHLERVDDDEDRVTDLTEACLIINRIKENSKPVYVSVH